MADIAGVYGKHHILAHLKLDAEGTYECFVFNGMAGDGCATVEGAVRGQLDL